jgi:NifU-like protein involved in Fe-S cluster formation
MNYSELTRDYFESAANAGELAGPGVFRGAAGNREQGTWVQFDLQVKVKAISAAKFLAFACPHTIAVAAWLAQQAVGRPLQPALPENVAALRERFAVPIEKMGRLLIIEDAWLAAVRQAIDYRDSTHIISGSGT